MHLDALASEIVARAPGHERFIVAISGPPGAGKSTLAEALNGCLDENGQNTAIVAQDGFHFDNCILEKEGWLDRKGAPHTFDVNGFHHTLQRIRNDNENVHVPVFDRSIELARAGAQEIKLSDRIIVVEGNYLLLNQQPWSRLKPQFDFTILLKVDMSELKNRSIARWLHYGYTREQASNWAESNDMPNAKFVLENSSAPDLLLENQEMPSC